MLGQTINTLFATSYSSGIGFTGVVTYNFPYRNTYVDVALSWVQPTEPGEDHGAIIRINSVLSTQEGYEQIWDDYDWGASLYRTGMYQVSILIFARRCLVAGRVARSYWS